MKDPTQTDPENYKVLFENARVRVLEYLDEPGTRTHDHDHPDSVMITLSGFQRRIHANGNNVDVNLPANQAKWLDAQTHRGENIGDTQTHTIFVELKEPAGDSAGETHRLGPQES